MLRSRLITGPLLVLGLIAIVWLDAWSAAGDEHRRGLWLTLLTVGLVIPLAGSEASTLLQSCRMIASRLTVQATAACFFLTIVAAGLYDEQGSTASLGIILGGGLLSVSIACLGGCRSRRVERGFTSILATIGASAWIGIGLGGWVLVAQVVGAAVAAGLVLVVKAGDIGAFFTGMTIGRHKLIPWLSPGKTIEGAIGALVWGGAAGAILAMATGVLSTPMGIVGGVLLAGFGAVGDLVESLLKREAGAKDSGDSLPGMGGLLDVLDSLLLTGPIAWLIIVFG